MSSRKNQTSKINALKNEQIYYLIGYRQTGWR